MCVKACMHACMHIRDCIYVYACINIYIYTHFFIYMHICVAHARIAERPHTGYFGYWFNADFGVPAISYVRVNILNSYCVYVYRHKLQACLGQCMHICSINIYIYVHIHTCLHAYMHISQPLPGKPMRCLTRRGWLRSSCCVGRLIR